MVLRPRSIRSHKLRFIAATGALALAAATFVVASSLRDARRSAEQEVRRAADVTALAIDGLLGDAELRLRSLAETPLMLELRQESCAPFLAEAARALPDFSTLFAVGIDAVPVCRSVEEQWRPEYGLASERPWWEEAVAPGARFVVSRPLVGAYSGIPVVVHTYPIIDGDGERIGILGMSRPLSDYTELLAVENLPDDHLVTVSDQSAAVITRSRDLGGWVGEDAPSLPSPNAGPVDAMPTRLGIQSAPAADGADYRWAWHELQGAPWTVWAGVPYSGIRTAGLEDAFFRLIFIALLFAVPIGLGALTLGAMERSLSEVLAWSASARGGFDDAVPTVSVDEIQELASSFGRTLEERNSALDSERVARRRVTSILNNAVLGIYVSDGRGIIRDANPAMARILGLPDEESVIGIDVGSLYADPEERRRILEADRRGETHAETEWVRPDGQTFPVRLSWRVWEMDEAPGYEVIAEDLSERRELETQFRQSQKMEAIGRLAGGVAHDFNNRLTVMTGHAEMLLDDLPDEHEARDYALAIMASAERSSELTAQLLAFSRKQSMRPRVIDVNDSVGRVLGMVGRLIGEDIEVVDRRGDTATVYADAGQLEQVLMNLCTNARDAMPVGGRLTLSTEIRDLSEEEARIQVDAHPGRYVILSVSDTGEGMDEETRSRIFEPFFTTKESGKGTGLGLATVYGIVSQAAGHLRVFSWPGTGTTFEVWLPWVGERVDPEVGPDVRAPTPTARGETVLVVEDEPEVREVTVRTLERLGYQVLEAGDGFEALSVAVATSDPVDLLITDVLMPGMKGPELARRLVDRGTVGRVLFVSGYAEGTPNVEVEDLPWDFVTKPFRSRALGEAVRALLERPAYVRSPESSLRS